MSEWFCFVILRVRQIKVTESQIYGLRQRESKLAVNLRRFLSLQVDSIPNVLIPKMIMVWFNHVRTARKVINNLMYNNVNGLTCCWFSMRASKYLIIAARKSFVRLRWKTFMNIINITIITIITILRFIMILFFHVHHTCIVPLIWPGLTTIYVRLSNKPLFRRLYEYFAHFRNEIACI